MPLGRKLLTLLRLGPEKYLWVLAFVFGSIARGETHAESDVDLMVILPQSDERPIRRDQRAQRCLGRLAVPADVLVRTRGEVNRYKHLRASLFHQVLNQGRKLYG